MKKACRSVKDNNIETCIACSIARGAAKRQKHGDYKARINAVWKGIVQRCKNPNSTKYENYGGRGIIVCAEWASSYATFKKWALTNGYTDELYIDRVDNNGDYSPHNCRFVTVTENNRNTRRIYNHNNTGFRGVSSPRGIKYRARIQVDKVSIHIGSFESALNAAHAYDLYIIEHKLSHTKNFRTSYYD